MSTSRRSATARRSSRPSWLVRVICHAAPLRRAGIVNSASTYLSVQPFIYPSICLSICPSICLSIAAIYPSIIDLSIYLFICLSVCVSICPPTHPSIHPPAHHDAPTAAGWVAASRVVDNMHSPADVLCGACIGAAAAAFSYCRSFGKGALHFPVREYSEHPPPGQPPSGLTDPLGVRRARCNAVATLVATQRNTATRDRLGSTPWLPWTAAPCSMVYLEYP
jgi:hypothetical protein